ncbi:MAG: helix-turn-helix domain-containing protein [Rhodospirillales bacterium]|nr:helix-turn-helix domain-containing protein [Rhodospirillales bacterium]
MYALQKCKSRCFALLTVHVRLNCSRPFVQLFVATRCQSANAMIPAMFSTHSLPASEQFDAWHGWYGSVFDTASRQPAGEGFRARNTTWRMGGVLFSRVSTPPIAITRTKALIRRNPVDHWGVNLGKQSAIDLKLERDAVKVPARVPFLISLDREMYQERARDRFQLYLARDSFQAIAPLLDAARGTALDTPEGKLLADYMLLLERNLPFLPASDGPKLAAAIQAMLGACLAPSADRIAEAGRHIDFTLMERVRQAVRRNLRSPSLGPDKLCREAATSRSQLYRLLEGEGGVAHYIQRRRLSESFTMLCDVTNNLPIGKVAEILCFADGSSFSRAFRREFGMSPSDARGGSLVGLPPSPPPSRSPAGPAVTSFSDCLRSM